MTYNDDTDNLYWEDDFDGSTKGLHDENDDDPYTGHFGFSVKDGDDDADVETALPLEDDEPLIDEDLAGLAGEKEEEEAE
ncbi:MAG: hypothetical protein WCO58_02765 [bacterium]